MKQEGRTADDGRRAKEDGDQTSEVGTLRPAAGVGGGLGSTTRRKAISLLAFHIVAVPYPLEVSHLTRIQ